jgi:hypothetical protein
MKRLGLAVLALLFVTPRLDAAIYSYGFTLTGPITNTVQSVSINTSGASGRARAFFVTGDWSIAGGDPWSNEFRVRLDGVTDVLGTLDRAHGGTNNGNNFSFGAPSVATWVNNVTTAPTGHGYNTMLANQASSDMGFQFSLGLRQTFTGSSANLSNAQVHFLTDAIAPVAFDSAASGLTMAARPTSLIATTAGAGGGYTYDLLSFTASTTGVKHLAMHISPAFDGYLLVYQGGFDPNNPLNNLVGLDDIGGLGDPNSADMFLGVTAGLQYTLVATTFTSINGGATRVAGLFTVAGVPEPSSLALLGLAGIGGFIRRRRSV